MGDDQRRPRGTDRPLPIEHRGHVRACQRPAACTLASPDHAREDQLTVASHTHLLSRCLWPTKRRSWLLYDVWVDELLDPDALSDDPFEVDAQAVHLFKHPYLGLDDVYEAWRSAPLFYPAKPPAHWLMVAEVSGRVLIVPIAPARDHDPSRCRPIGCYEATPGLASTYRRDRDHA